MCRCLYFRVARELAHVAANSCVDTISGASRDSFLPDLGRDATPGDGRVFGADGRKRARDPGPVRRTWHEQERDQGDRSPRSCDPSDRSSARDHPGKEPTHLENDILSLIPVLSGDRGCTRGGVTDRKR